MPDQTEELRLIVSLTDNASAGLVRLRGEMAKLGGGTESTAKLRQELDALKKALGDFGGGSNQAAMIRLQRTLEGLARGSFRPLAEQVGSLGGGFSVMVRGMGVAAAGIGGLAAAAYTAHKSMEELASTMTRWQQLSTQTGIPIGQLRVMADQMRQGGMSAEQSNRILSNLSANMARFARDRQNFVHEMMRDVSEPDREGIRKELEALDPLTQNPAAFANKVKEISEKVRRSALAETGDPKRAAVARDTVLRWFGLEGLEHFEGAFKEATKEQLALQKQLADAAKQYNEVAGQLATNWDRITDAYGKIAIEKLQPFLEQLDRLTAALARVLEALATHKETPEEKKEREWEMTPPLEQLGKIIRGDPTAQRPGTTPSNPTTRSGVPMRFMGGDGETTNGLPGGWGRMPLSDNVIDLRNATDESTEQSEKLTNELKKLNDFYETLFQQNKTGAGSSGGGAPAGGDGGGGPSGSTPQTAFSPPNTGGVTAPGPTGTGATASPFPSVPGSLGGATGGGAAPIYMPGTGTPFSVPAPGQTAAAPENPVTGAGEPYLAQQRAGFARELQNNPETRALLGAIVGAENPYGKAGVGVVESLFNRTAMVNEQRARKGLPPLSLRDAMWGKDPSGKASFYGPVRRPWQLNRELARLKDPAWRAKIDAMIDEAVGGSNWIQMYTDQGSQSDPNYERGGTGVNIRGNEFSPYGGRGWERFNDFNPAAAAWRRRQLEAIRQARTRTPTSRADRTAMDRAYSQTMAITGTGHIKVDVKRDRLASGADAVFKPVPTDTNAQMPPVDTGGAKWIAGTEGVVSP